CLSILHGSATSTAPGSPPSSKGCKTSSNTAAPSLSPVSRNPSAPSSKSHASTRYSASTLTSTPPWPRLRHDSRLKPFSFLCEGIERALHTYPGPIEHVRVNHGRAHIFVSQ